MSTNKIDLIKAEIERLKEKGYPINTFEGSAGYYDALDEVLSFIDSLPEEHVSKDLEEFIIAKYNEVIGSHGEYDKTYIDGMAKAAAIECGMACAQWNKERLDKVIKLADAMYYAAFNMTTDASRLRKAMNDYHNFIIHMNKED